MTNGNEYFFFSRCSVNNLISETYTKQLPRASSINMDFLANTAVGVLGMAGEGADVGNTVHLSIPLR